MKMLLNLLFFIILTNSIINVKTIRIENSAYHDIVVDINDNVPVEHCAEILRNLESGITKASETLYTALNGRAHFGTFLINLPNAWTEKCLPSPQRPITSSHGEPSDITVTVSHKIFNNRIWTQQSGGCGQQGDQIYLSYLGLVSEYFHKEFIREWGKYRYGIFDEIGFPGDKSYPQCYVDDKQQVTGCSDGRIKNTSICQSPNSFADLLKTISKKSQSSLMFVPQADNVVKFCDDENHNKYAPTKHNLLCDRRSTSSVIFDHADFRLHNSSAKSSNSSRLSWKPEFIYRHRNLTRYIVLIDDNQDLAIREAWSFLRTALRKWMHFDLVTNTEVGVVLMTEDADRVSSIERFDSQDNRDSMASFIPYSASNTHMPPCIHCGIQKAFNMLAERERAEGPANQIILIIAPGLNYDSDYNSIVNAAVSKKIRFFTINYPRIVRRQSLDQLALRTGGIPFTIEEKKQNSEESFLQTYFELTIVLNYISEVNNEGSKLTYPLEIHRRELFDIGTHPSHLTQGNRIISGSFFMEEHMEPPSGFYVYTHNTIPPLINNIVLTSPTGANFEARSDRRMLVNQLSVIAALNTSGPWTYRIDRTNGNPQSHFIHVIATPDAPDAPIIRTRAWIRRSPNNGPLVIFCEVKRGIYPINSALVEVVVTPPQINCNRTSGCKEQFRLLDTGSGDPDVTKGDGIYSRYYSTHGGNAGIYKFEMIVDDNGNSAYSLNENSSYRDKPCCGSIIPDEEIEPVSPFQRFLPPISVDILVPEVAPEVSGRFGRIGDLMAESLEEEGKVRLSWSSPDMGGYSAHKYEIKFAFKIQDVVENYDTVAMPWKVGTPHLFSIGDKINFLLDINAEPQLYGEAAFFVVRPLLKFEEDFVAGHISNPASIFIPQKIRSTIPPRVHSSNGPDQWSNDNGPTYEDKEANADGSGKFKYAIPIASAIIIIFIIIFMYVMRCVYLRIKRDRERTEQTKNPTNLNSDDDINSRNMIGDCNSPKNGGNESPFHLEKQQPSTIPIYSRIGIPDHHTIGIPIYSDDEIQKKRLSITNLQEKLLIEELKQNQHQNSNSDRIEIIADPAMYTNCGSFSVISSSNNTLPRQGRTLSPYESWTASQLLLEHQRRTSPTDELITQVGGGVPQMQLIHYPDQGQLQIQPQHQHHRPQIELMTHDTDGGSSMTGSTTAPPVPPLPYSSDEYQAPAQINGIPIAQGPPQLGIYGTSSRMPPTMPAYNPSLQGSLMSVNNSDKKRRNVTMV